MPIAREQREQSGFVLMSEGLGKSVSSRRSASIISNEGTHI